MIEPPLERLNYYNGQRLEAGDLKLEQEYHIRTRRWLNKSLYTTGIASGLDVRKENGTRTIIVSPGLALDAEGREILLLEDARLTVPGKPHKKTPGSDATVEGLYLTIRYNEESIHEERNGCVLQSESGKQNGNRPAWGGPARVQAKPQFNWRDSLPYESSGEVLLAQVELTPDCSQVHQVNTGVRRYVGAASDAKVRQYALEGERHIDKDNPGKIYFHIRGRQPKSVTLYLRAEIFSTLYYSELGQHDHSLTVVGTLGGPINLTDGSASLNTDIESGASPTDPATHEHRSFPAAHIGNSGATDSAILLIDVANNRSRGLVGLPLAAVTVPPGPVVTAPLIPYGTSDLLPHVSTTSGAGNNDFNAVIAGATPHVHQYQHTHGFTQGAASGVGTTGVSDWKARGTITKPETALTFVDDLQVWIGPDLANLTNQTASILSQLRASQPTQVWDKLGGGAGHALAVKGTGEIKLDFLPNVSFTEGEYVIKLSVANGGGRILYNLYVE